MAIFIFFLDLKNSNLYQSSELGKKEDDKFFVLEMQNNLYELQLYEQKSELESIYGNIQ